MRALEYHCPQQREKLAYQVQEEWLAMFGEDLKSAYGLDAFTLTIYDQLLLVMPANCCRPQEFRRELLRARTADQAERAVDILGQHVDDGAARLPRRPPAMP
jgi:hypothetical protein